ncbi:sugar transporter domain-containing protein [Trichoderma breve]|uniref:Sugar transporter domain-containing protein n=1 Tax=Trichoderma breve TaxID=2034170 RepID=A0A9W9B7S8_9HYPO|nr:sugar transporter domain-containing protein [Trichoderma breve]KAJ4857534.1 sugar transporter domain-containing protein [Trichoderma breve]
MEKSLAVAHAEDLPIEPNEKLAINEVADKAKQGAEAEHNLHPLKALRLYPKAIFWCLVVSACVIMEGYDTNLLSNFYAYPEFAKKYGHFNEATNNYQLSAPWQAGLGNASNVGSFFGTLLNGYLVLRFGHVKVILGSLATMSAFVFIVFFAPNTKVLLVGELLCGLPWGIFATTAPAYASEVLPMTLRVYLTSWTNMCFIIGQLISAGIFAGLVNNTTEWSYRIPFAVQWVWPGRHEEAKESLRKLRSNPSEEELQESLNLIIYTNNLEEQLSVGTSYWDCFKGFELRRTEIACMVFAGQVLSGINFAYNSTYFFQQVGLTTEQTYHLGVGGNGMALFGTIVSWVLIMPYFGRRTTYVVGMGVMSAILIIIGGLNAKTSNHHVGLAQAILTLVWTFVFQLSAGQLARNAYAVTGIVAGVLQPYFMNPTQWNLKGYTGFVWGGTAFVTFVWAYFRLPESKDRTYEELDILFARNVPARKFASYKIDAFQNDALP